MKDEAMNIASQCRATASSPLAKNILVDGGSGLLIELLLDSARVIEDLAQPAQEPDKYLYRVDVSRREDNTCTEYDHPIYFHSKADANNYCWTINQAPYPRNTIVVAKCVDIKIAPPPPQHKPLTDEQIETIWRRVQANDFHDCVQPFARAIEAAHSIGDKT